MFVTHDLAVARVVADRIAVMYLGRIVEIGPAEEIANDPAHPYTQALRRPIPDLGGNRRVPPASSRVRCPRRPAVRTTQGVRWRFECATRDQPLYPVGETPIGAVACIHREGRDVGRT